ncbi:arginine kinase [Condylostylus longicornis]|uniref:arginine kinase n=1 Tax=Condylostylus longicornis TaxID=2530218 RepID=UPI00244E4B10|nr:arginine kinase [Condylostylus longicornis]
MATIEAKREQFRKYLERCGLIDSLSRALIKLYEEQNKPDDCIRYVRKYMCDSCPDDEDYDELKENYEKLKLKIVELEEELEKFRADVTRTPSEILSLLEDGWKKLQSDTTDSLLKKYFTNEILEELKSVNTTKNATLLDCLQSGLKFHESKLGIYVADPECYDTYKSLFDPIIISYHNIEDSNAEKLQNDIDWGNIADIGDLDPEEKYILSTKCRVIRNLENTAFSPILKQEEFLEIEDKVKKACEQLKGDLSGNYRTLKEIDLVTQEQMIKNHILYKKGNEYLSAAGCYRYWPTGRGIYTNEKENFIVWVNEQDHMRIISMSKGGNLGEVYNRLVDGVQTIENSIKVERHSKYGNVTINPCNLGTSLKASVHIRLPNLSRDDDRFKEMLNQLQLQVRDTADVYTTLEEGVLDISNKRCLGHSEFEILQCLQEGIKELIKAEEELE